MVLFQYLSCVLQNLQVISLHMFLPLLPDAFGTMTICSGIKQGSNIPLSSSSHKIQEYPACWGQTVQLAMRRADITLLQSVRKNVLWILKLTH